MQMPYERSQGLAWLYGKMPAIDPPERFVHQAHSEPEYFLINSLVSSNSAGFDLGASEDSSFPLEKQAEKNKRLKKRGGMQLEHMREFVSVVDEGSFTAAAEKNFVAQPVLSKHVQGIERELNTQLLIRSPKGLILTPLGEEAYAAFAAILDRFDVLLAKAHEQGSHTAGQLHIGILTMGVDKYIAPIVTAFTHRFPNIVITYSTEKPQNIFSNLLDGKLDIGFMAKSNFNDRGALSYHLVGYDELKIALPTNHPAAQRGNITPADLVDNPLVCLKLQETTDTLNSMIFAAGFKPKRIRKVDELEIAPSTTVAINGYFVISDFMSSVFEGFRDIRVTNLARPLYQPVYFAYKTSGANPVVRLFLDNIPPLERALEAESTAANEA